MMAWLRGMSANVGVPGCFCVSVGAQTVVANPDGDGLVCLRLATGPCLCFGVGPFIYTHF